MSSQQPTQPGLPPISATIVLTQIQFQPWAPGKYTTASFALAQKVPGISLQGETIVVAVPPNQTVNLTFQVPDPAYVLLGIAFNPGQAGASQGRDEFPLVTIQREANKNQMTVRDESLALFYNVDFAYVILIQQVATGLIGVIDPDIINEPEVPPAR
jgi:hypothetical protein